MLKIFMRLINLFLIINFIGGCSTNKPEIELFSITDQVAMFYEVQKDIKLMDDIFFTSVYTRYRALQTLKMKGEKPVVYQSKYETVMFDCLKKVFSAPDTLYYSNNNVRGYIVYSSVIAPPDVKWIPIEKDPIYSVLFKKLAGVCTPV